MSDTTTTAPTYAAVLAPTTDRDAWRVALLDDDGTTAVVTAYDCRALGDGAAYGAAADHAASLADLLAGAAVVWQVGTATMPDGVDVPAYRATVDAHHAGAHRVEILPGDSWSYGVDGWHMVGTPVGPGACRVSDTHATLGAALADAAEYLADPYGYTFGADYWRELA